MTDDTRRPPRRSNDNGGGFAAADLSHRAAQLTGPPLRPQGSLPRSLRDGLRPPLTPETSAAPGSQPRGQARALPGRCAARTPRAPRPTIPSTGVSTVSGDCQGGGGVPERGRGVRHCQAHIRVSSSQVGCSQDGAPHLRRASVGSKHSRGSFLPRRASRYTTGLDRGAGCAHRVLSWSSPPTRTRRARGRSPRPPPT